MVSCQLLSGAVTPADGDAVDTTIGSGEHVGVGVTHHDGIGRSTAGLGQHRGDDLRRRFHGIAHPVAKDSDKNDVWKEPVPMLRGPNSPERFYGSGYLFYPPRTENEHWSSSLRWENYVQGAEDYSLMMMLKERWENTRNALNVKSEDFDGFAALEMFWGMLGSSFRVQSYYAEPLYIDRFRQLLAHEISAHTAKPLALVDIQPVDAHALESIHVRCLAEKGCTFKINGEAPNWLASDGSSCSTELMLKPGYNLITVQITGKDGKVKNLYREVLKNAPLK